MKVGKIGRVLDCGGKAGAATPLSDGRSAGNVRADRGRAKAAWRCASSRSPRPVRFQRRDHAIM